MDAYEKVRVIGRGAYGVVTLCTRKSDGQKVIIKAIPVEEMTTGERQAALTEVKVLKILSHPTIVAYFDSFVEDKALMIVMEFAEGGTIFEYIQSRAELISEDLVMHFFVQMVLSLKHIHAQNILHRDMKTQNVMLDRTKRVVKIGDFGISKVLSSKSKANTVVGTPCYISPELCEGKPYDQKSDIWALGCVLYEMVSLRRAFDAPNLPALVLKIMRGRFAPISDTYSEELQDLILSMLHLNPNERPRINHILALPICQNALLNMQAGLGQLQPSLPSANLSLSKSAVRVMPTLVLTDHVGSRGETQVFGWGGGCDRPAKFEGFAGTEIRAVTGGRTQHWGVSADGELLAWKLSPQKMRRRRSSCSGDQLSDSASGSMVWVPRLYGGLSGVRIQRVACGDSFVACLSDKGIVLTFGSGAQGCLGHGDYEDLDQARIVEPLLGYEVNEIACGGSHVLCVTSEHEVFGWGSASNGRLGRDADDTLCSAQPIETPPGEQITKVYCGRDCSMFLTEAGKLYACGSNRHNKLALNKTQASATSSSPSILVSAQEAHSIMEAQAEELGQRSIRTASIGAHHSAIVTTEGLCFTFGSNQYGQLGRDADSAASARVTALDSERVVQVACGDSFTAALTESHKVFTWGRAEGGRLGRFTLEDSPEPRLVDLPRGAVVRDLHAAYGHTLVTAEATDAAPRKRSSSLIHSSDPPSPSSRGARRAPMATISSFA